MRTDRLGAWRPELAEGLLALLALAVVAGADGWRLAVLTAAAAAAVAATRIRWAGWAGLALIAVVAGFAVAGPPIAGNERPEAVRGGDGEPRREDGRR